MSLCLSRLSVLSVSLFLLHLLVLTIYFSNMFFFFFFFCSFPQKTSTTFSGRWVDGGQQLGHGRFFTPPLSPPPPPPPPQQQQQQQQYRKLAVSCEFGFPTPPCPQIDSLCIMIWFSTTCFRTRNCIPDVPVCHNLKTLLGLNKL